VSQRAHECVVADPIEFARYGFETDVAHEATPAFVLDGFRFGLAFLTARRCSIGLKRASVRYSTSPAPGRFGETHEVQPNSPDFPSCTGGASSAFRPNSTSKSEW
jgi:hypothetical protein